MARRFRRQSCLAYGCCSRYIVVSRWKEPESTLLACSAGSINAQYNQNVKITEVVPTKVTW